MAIRDVDFANLGLFVSQVDATSTTGHTPSNMSGITCLQSVNASTDIPLENVGCAGKTATSKVNNEAPNVTLDFTYHAVDMYNEAALGFTINSTNTCLNRIMTKDVDERNYYIPISDEGQDLEDAVPADYQVLAIGNGFISSYSTEGSVGNFATTSISVQGSNVSAHSDGVSEANPAVDANGAGVGGTFTLPNGLATISGQPTVIGQGDIVFEVARNDDGTLFYNPTGLCIQGYNISFDLNRSARQCLGNKFPNSRKITFPIDVDMSIDALGGDLATGNLANILCYDATNTYDLAVTLYEPSCDTARGTACARYELKNAVFQGFSANSSQGDDQGQTVTINYQGSIAADGDTSNGLFFSGIYGYNGGTGIYSA